ncbi:SDR family oxidoreductase [Pararobbsia silviterrae]|uniref:SDR family NAD(P)-dependent oxidoreductase n=1 Tax=Pararobbsia silviterrae TaxID=1792498 RepID=A0A494X925_9BURK|nr:SDR family NAD(P)-dependent oxidoreductase [Pararobbsia silviterrae]RKP46121.1 SDR family NAD(P)-dependent oxidoreductase [Pararobbsia silviterrae]
MKLTGNTIFITGGGSGIGRGLAEALHKRGNQVIISGRRRSHLDEVVAANRGMAAIELDITDPASIAKVAAQLVADYPDLNVLINNAGVMLPDEAAGHIDDALMVSTIETNLMGPIRMTSALIDHLKTKRDAVIAYNSSVLAFVPLAMTAVYSSTKAAVHSYVLSQRFLLKDTNVRVLEIAPPWVRTDLMNSREAEQAMPLDAFIDETVAVLGTDVDEVLVEIAKPFRNNPGPGEHAFVNGLNTQMLEVFNASRADA